MQGWRSQSTARRPEHQRRRGKASASGTDGHAVLPVWDASSRPRVIELAAASACFSTFPAAACRSRSIRGPAESFILIHLALEPALLVLARTQERSISARRAPCAGPEPAVCTLASGPPVGRECRNSGATMVGHGILGPNGVVFPMRCSRSCGGRGPWGFRSGWRPLKRRFCSALFDGMLPGWVLFCLSEY